MAPSSSWIAAAVCAVWAKRSEEHTSELQSRLPYTTLFRSEHAFRAGLLHFRGERGRKKMKIKFWGARGSTPTPERRNARYGGNSACIEVRLANGTIIILDCGSGLRGLGKKIGRAHV